MDRKYVIFTVKTVTVKLYTLVVILSLFYSFSVPALTEVTASAINGTPPYISANQDRTPSDISDLLWIAIKKNGDHSQTTPSSSEPTSVEDPNLIYYHSDFNSSPDEIIDLPESIDTFDKIVTLISGYQNEQVELETILTDKQYFEDNDGDDGFKATGTLKLEIKDNKNNQIKLNDQLDSCVGYYTLTLETTDSELSTIYGLPNINHYPSVSKTYYIRSSGTGLPKVCWLQPSLEKGSPPFAYTQQEYDDFFNKYPWEKDDTQIWIPNKGFKATEIIDSWERFPTTAADKLYFNVVLSGAKWQDISYIKKPSDSPIELKLSGQNNQLRVEFSGPNFENEVSEDDADLANYTEFSLKVGDRVIYSFEIEYWFYISNETVKAQKYAKQYCSCKGTAMDPGGPEILTNALYDNYKFGQNNKNHYIREVNFLLAEWGNTINEVYPNKNAQGDKISNVFWTWKKVNDQDEYHDLMKKNRSFKIKSRNISYNGWNEWDDDDNCNEDPVNRYPTGTQFYAIDFNDGSIKKLPQEIEGLRVICVSD